jgi:hypothetical protein
MTPDREEVLKMAQAIWPSDRRMWSVDADLPRLERFAAHFYEAGARAEREKRLAAEAERDNYRARWEGERKTTESMISGGYYPDGRPAW